MATERRRMAEAREGKFSELFKVIQEYARREYDYQDKALQVLAGSYTFMFESEDMPDARGVVGNLDPLSVDAVVKVALYKEEYMEWGLNRLSKILEGLFRRSRTDETYSDYVTDAEVVIRGIERIVAGSVLEEILEGDNGA
jgi:hypothetical protein